MRADCLPHAHVTVKVDNAALTEHQTEHASGSDGMTATTFVEATVGAEFTVHLLLEREFAYRNPHDRLAFRLSVDGEWVAAKILPTASLPTTELITGMKERKANLCTIKRFSFAEHNSTDGHVQPSLMKKLAELGEIKVELKRCRETGTSTTTIANYQGMNKDDIPEKAMKGRSVSSHAKLGHAEVIPPFEYVNVTYPYGGPIATYVFQYRSRTDLEIEGIVERPPSPVPLTERDPDELTRDELREQNRLLRAERASAAKVKKEVKREKRARERSVTLSDGNGNDHEDDEGEVTITGESDRRRKRARTSAGAVDTVDLTED